MRRAGYAMAGVVACGVLLRCVLAQDLTGLPPNARCIAHLKLITLATRMYAQDYDDRLPPMKPVPYAKNPVAAYNGNREWFACPETDKAYVPNQAIQYRLLDSFADPSKVWVYRDMKAHRDGSWGISRLDGHARREPRPPKQADRRPTAQK